MEIPRENEPIAIQGGNVHFKDLDLEAEEFLHVTVEQQGVDVALSLERRKKKEAEEIARVDRPTGRYGPEDLLFIASEAGPYRVKVEAPVGEPSGHYTFQTLARRPATPEDRELVEADRTFWQGRGLLKDGAHAQAAERLEEALAVFSRRGLTRRQAETLDALCLAHQGREAMEVALGFCDQAVEGYRRVGDRNYLPFLLDQAGWLRLRLSRAREALAPIQEARSLFEESGEDRGIASALSHLGGAYYVLGRLEDALQAFDRAMEAVRRTGDRLLEGAILCDAARALLALRRPRDARDRYAAAIEIYREREDLASLAMALAGFADAASEAGEPAQAEPALAESLALLRRSDDQRNLAVALNSLGTLRRRQGDFTGAGSAYEEALKRVRETGDRRSEALILVGLGYLHVLQRDPARGLERCEEARALFVELGDLKGEASAQARSAEALRDLGRLSEAWERIRLALERIEGSPLVGEGSAADEDQEAPAIAARLPFRADYYEIGVDILMRRHAQEPEAGHHLRALELNERRLLGELASSEPAAGATPARVGPAGVAKLQAVLDGDSLLLVLAPGAAKSSQSYSWMISPQEVIAYSLPPPADLEAWAQILMAGEEATSGDRFDEARLSLSRHLLGPVASRLGHKRLIFVAPEPLGSIPFAILPDPGPGRSGEPLSQHHQVQALPSLTAVLAVTERRGTKVVVSSHRSIEEAGAPSQPVNPGHSDTPGGNDTELPRGEEIDPELAAAQAAHRERRRREALSFREEGGQEGAGRVARATPGSIEQAGVPSQPVNPGHSDTPGWGDLRSGPSEEAATALDRAEAVYRERRRREALGSQEGGPARESAELAGEGGAAPQKELEVCPEIDPQTLSRLLVASWRQETLEYKEHKDEADLCREYEEASKEEIELRKRRRELPTGVDPHDLSQTGWGVLFSRDEDPAVRLHLRKLLDRRQEQAGRRFQELTHYPRESARRFLWFRHGESPGVLDPEILPYYILIVGDPATIPYEFQYELAINHAVGRIYFEKPADYARYAEAVLEAEDQGVRLPRQAAILAVENQGDSTTTLLREHLVAPLSQELKDHAEWEVEVWDKEKAYKRDFQELLGGPSTPGLLLVSCHGTRFAPKSEGQEAYQGALLCQEWKKGTPATEDQFFHAGDVAKDGHLHGLIAFLFACYGAGTPLEDNFPHQVEGGMVVGQPPKARPLTLRPFVARLPQALLRSGALAVVGHVDRGWTTAYQWQYGGSASEAVRSLKDSLIQLLEGHRIGHTFRPVVRRYTAIAAQLAESMERVRNGEPVDEEMVAFQWTAHNDARNLILLGDPAVYLLGQRCWHEESETRQEQEPTGAERTWEPAFPGTGRASTKAHGVHGGPGETSPGSPVSIKLDAGISRFASEKARQRQMTVEQWVNAVLRSRADDDGFFLGEE